MTSSRPRRVAARFTTSIALMAAVAMVASACGGGDAPAEGASASAEPTASPTEAAQVAETGGVRLAAPASWKVEFKEPQWTLDPVLDDGASPGGAVFKVDEDGLVEDLESMAKGALAFAPDGKRLPDVKYGGETFYHVRSSDDIVVYDSYGAYLGGGKVVYVEWTLNKKMVDRKQMDAWIDQLMSTYKYDG